MGIPQLHQNLSELNHHLVDLERGEFGWIRYPPGGRLGPRQQRGLQLVVLETGSLNITVDETEVRLTPGNFILLAPDRRETFRFDRRQTSVHTWCSIGLPSPRASFTALLALLPAVGTTDRRLRLLMDAGLGVHDESDRIVSRSAPGALVSALFTAAFPLLPSWAQPTAHQAPRSPRQLIADETRKRIDHDFDRAWNLASLAREAGVTPQHLLRCFREVGLPSPIRTLWQVRLERGRQLLQETGLTIQQIADRCGFASAFHFSRRIRETTGVSPRTYRQRSWASR